MAKKQTTYKEEQDKSLEKRKFWEIISDDEKEEIKEDINKLIQMRDNLRRPVIEFDDQTFFQQYEENRKADLAYNRPIDETVDFRVTTGLTREKDTTLLSTATNFNFKPNITSFDKDNMIIAGLGQEMEDLVMKSRELEDWDEKRISIYRELIAQGTVFVEETYVERAIKKHNPDDSWDPTMPVADYKGDEYPLYDIEGKCEARLYLGKYVLLSSMNEEELQNNAIVALYEEVDRGVAESVYGKWERWKYVPDEVSEQNNPFKDGSLAMAGSDFSWNVYKVGKGKVGITKVMKRFENEYQIYLNGIPMLPCEFPLTKFSPSGLYPIAKGLGERIPNFAYGKGTPSKTKVDQKLYDTLLRAMVGKAWQSYRPTLGNRSGNVLSRDIIASGNIVHGIKQNDIFPILPTQLLSVNAADISMFEMVKEIINDKSVSDSYGAQTQQANTTATQIVNEQKQTMLKLASTIDGIKGLERRLALLRIYNIVAHYTKAADSPMEKEILKVVDGISTVTGKEISANEKVRKYKKFTQDKSFSGGQQGIKMTHFVGETEPLISVREQINMEEKMKDEYGKPVRISYISAEWLRNLNCIWDIGITVQSDQDDQMQLLVFIDNVTRIASLFGVQAFKQDYVLQRVAEKMSEDFDKMFNTTDGAGAMQQMQQMLGGGTQVKNPVQQMANSQKPSPLSVAKMG